MTYKVHQMQFNKILFFLLAMIVLSCNQNENNSITSTQQEVPTLIIAKDSLELNPNEGLVYYQNKPFTGISVANHHNDQKSNQTTFVNGKKNGLKTMWFEDGTKSFESNYVNGKQDGKVFTWWKNEQKRSEANYEKGVPNGEQLQWYKSGVKFKKMNLVNGKEEGIQQSWRENGKLYNNYEAKNGRIFGLKRATLCYELEDGEVQYK
jgi:antitoxin component YwqK of YwqJK toxin-antitoxin module